MNKRILLIDDEPALVRIVERFAKWHKWPLETVHYPFSESPFRQDNGADMVICDGLDRKWEEVYSEALKANPKTYFVVFSGDYDIISRAKENGIVAVQKEPTIFSEQINEMIGSYLKTQE